MQLKDDITNISQEMDELYGKEGMPEREAFRREAYAYCNNGLLDC